MLIHLPDGNQDGRLNWVLNPQAASYGLQFGVKQDTDVIHGQMRLRLRSGIKARDYNSYLQLLPTTLTYNSYLQLLPTTLTYNSYLVLQLQYGKRGKKRKMCICG